MRLVIDMQGAQTASRFRGIGRITIFQVQEMARQRGEHEILLVVNAAFPDTIEPIRAAFAGLLPADAIHVFEVPRPVDGMFAANKARRVFAERMLDAFFAQLQPDVIFISSLIEQDESVASVHSLSNDIPTAVLFYDLIPLIYPDLYVQDEGAKLWYFTKLDHLKRADLLLSISESSGNEARDLVGFPEQSIVNVSSAGDAHFYPFNLSIAQRTHLEATYCIDRPFVMYTGGTDPRKNLEGLIRAFAKLSNELLAKYALVLVGRDVFDQQKYFINLAKAAGLKETALIFTGYISDFELNLLYNACSLFVFPSFHEGFGLPVLEAMACGKAVIAANSSSLPEVLGRQDVLFAARDDTAMAAKMTEVLSNVQFRQELERHGLEQAKKFSWKLTARRAWGALENLHAQQSAQCSGVQFKTGHRPKLAFVAPLPPVKTDVADYSSELLPELARHYDITVIVQQESVQDVWVQANVPICNPNWFRQHVHRFDRVLYQMGNSDQHIFMLALMAEIPGIVVLHDFYLSKLLARDMEEQPEYFRAWTNALYQSHGWRAVADRFLPDQAVDLVMTLPCNLQVLQQALGIIVHTDFVRQLAYQFYGREAAKNWSIIPQLLKPASLENKATARQKLGFLPQDFIICNFGGLGETMLNQRLLDAWLDSSISAKSNCYLVFVGESDGAEYKQMLVQTSIQSLAKDRIRIIGCVSTEAYHDWMVAADVAVSLRALSHGESLGAVLDCMNHALPLIVNAYGEMAELPSEAVWLLPNNFFDAQLTDAINVLYHDQARRRELGTRALAYIRTRHNSYCCAEQYAHAIEASYTKSDSKLYDLQKALPELMPPLPLSEYPLIAKVLSSNFPPQPRRRQLLVDVSELVQRDAKTGIQRIVRAILEQLIKNPPIGWTVEPVYAVIGQPGYRYARQFMCRFLDIPGGWAEDTSVQAWREDIFIGLDFQHSVVVSQEGVYNGWRNRGVRVYFVVYDLLPVLMPEAFVEGFQGAHDHWLHVLTRMDGALCISRAVADELFDWLQVFGDKRLRPFYIDWFHLGADVDNSKPSYGLPIDAPHVLSSLTARPSFLMVGTLEPRKGHLQTLLAFDRLWAQGLDCNLVIVGKEGWRISETVQAIRSHQELGRRLFWLEGISDEYLEKVYAASTCLIAPSYGEGFGLPLIEAAGHGLPLLVRDIPVFREVTEEYATFFTNTRQPEVIAEAVSHWLELYQTGQYRSSDAMPCLTWEESARSMINVVLKNPLEPYRAWLPDGVRRFWGADSRLYTQVGQAKGCSVHSTGMAGYLIYGPYEHFEAGQYRLVVRGRSDQWVGEEAVTIAYDKGIKKICKFDMGSLPLGIFLMERDFILEKGCQDLEVQVWVESESQVCIDDFMLEMVPPL